jgi:hypothetical protein
MSTSRCILLHHAHIGDEHVIPSFIDSICLVLRNYEQVTLPTPRSCPHSRSTHVSLCRFVSLSTTRFMSTPHCILIHHAHIGDQHIPSFIDLIRLVLQEDEHVSSCILLNHAQNGDQLISSFVNSFRLDLHDHVTLHTPRSCPRWRSTHPYLSRFDCLSLQDCEHITLHPPLSCPYWK